MFDHDEILEAFEAATGQARHDWQAQAFEAAYLERGAARNTGSLRPMAGDICGLGARRAFNPSGLEE
jgi:hypothetical protein